jgi:hypothetical protein
VVRSEKTWIPNFLLGYLLSIKEDQIAAALTYVACNGHKGDIVSADELLELGARLVTE